MERTVERSKILGIQIRENNFVELSK